MPYLDWQKTIQESQIDESVKLTEEAIWFSKFDLYSDSDAEVLLASIYIKNVDSAKAEPLLRNIIAKDPTNRSAKISLAQFLSNSLRYEEASQTIAGLDPENNLEKILWIIDYQMG